MERVLSQIAPDATTVTEFYRVPTARTVRVTALVVCNRGAAAGTFRIALSARGVALADKQYLFYDEALEANTTRWLALPGLVLQAADLLRSYASSADFTFSLFGDEF